MCGISAILTKKSNVNELLYNSLKQLQNRGYDSAGITTLNSKFSTIKYASDTNMLALDKLKNNLNILPHSNLGIAHTRWATHGSKTDINSHPHMSCDGKICLVHNGIIENFKIIKDNLTNEGYTFKSQTDTEVIANLIAFNYKKNKDIIKSINLTNNVLKGTWGLAILCIDNPNTIFCVRHGSPILISENNDYVIICSEQSGFCGLVNNYFILENNDICIISLKNNKISVNTNQNYSLKNIVEQNLELSHKPYPNWTLKEIMEQKNSCLRAISLGGRLLNDNEVRLGGLEIEKENLKRIENLIVLGCGTSYNAGLIGVSYFKNLCNFNTVTIYDGAEFTKKDIPKIGKTALLLLSQSGETKDLHRCIKIGRDNDLFLIGVINVVDSMIAREVNCGCYLNAGREMSVASTKSFTSQVIVLSMIAIWFAQIHEINLVKRKKYIKSLRNLGNDFNETLNISKSNIKNYIHSLNKNNLFVLGKEKAKAIALEGALKIKEITYNHAEGYSGSSLKHGPFALLDENTPVIMVMPNDEYYIKMENIYYEIKSRNSPIFVITNNKTCKLKNNIVIPDNLIYNDLLCIIPLQFIAYYISILKNINPDIPRNLAKVVTTE